MIDLYAEAHITDDVRCSVCNRGFMYREQAVEHCFRKCDVCRRRCCSLRFGTCDACSTARTEARQQSVVGKRIVKADYSSGSVWLELEDGTSLRVSDSGPMDGHGEYSFTVSIRLPGER